MEERDQTRMDYHMHEQLLQHRERVICPTADIMISEPTTKVFIELFEDLSNSNSIYLNKRNKT